MLNPPHPILLPLLEKHNITWEQFRKLGVPPKGMREKRSAIVTELHLAGHTWKGMEEITGFGNAAIQNLTQAKGCPAAKKHQQESGARNGHLGAGVEKPYLREHMVQKWAAGVFDFHKGRVCSPQEIAKLKASFTPERREQMSISRTQLWQEPQFRNNLLAFHQSPEERARRSQDQGRRLAEEPEKWSRGIGCYVEALTRCTNGNRIWVRSTYEKAAVGLLEAHPDIVSYQYEERIPVADGFEIRPDFIVTYTDGHVCLVEVKASWALKMPTDHKISIRLEKSRVAAAERGWQFATWTEKDVLRDALFPTG